MKFIEAFFLGLLIACTSLISQVFFTVIAELFFRFNLNFEYTLDDSIMYITLTILIAATIEELLRYIVIKKRMCTDSHPIATTLIQGIFLGFGFTLFEIILVSLSTSIVNIPITMILPVLTMHITLSIFLLFTIKPNQSKSKDTLYILLAIVFHTIGNLLIYFL